MILTTRRLTIAGLLIVVAACNPANLPNQEAPSPGSPAEETAAEEAAAEAAALQAECEAQFRDLLDELAALDSRLAVGVQFVFPAHALLILEERLAEQEAEGVTMPEGMERDELALRILVVASLPRSSVTRQA
jgi:hypothetical protein